MVSEPESLSAPPLLLNVIVLRSFMRVVHRQQFREDRMMLSTQIVSVWADFIHSRIHQELLIGNRDYSVFDILRYSVNDVKYILAERYAPQELDYDVVCMATLSNPVRMFVDVAPKTKRVTNTLPSLLLH